MLEHPELYSEPLRRTLKIYRKLRDREIPVRYDTAPARFRDLLQALHKETGRRVAVLVDEYDKPILDALVEAPEVARANRDCLRGLYGVIKDCDAHVRFTFLTGISKLSKVNLFSQLNNLTDLHPGPSLLVDLRLHGG